MKEQSKLSDSITTASLKNPASLLAILEFLPLRMKGYESMFTMLSPSGEEIFQDLGHEI